MLSKEEMVSWIVHDETDRLLPLELWMSLSPLGGRIKNVFGGRVYPAGLYFSLGVIVTGCPDGVCS
jgi:hypothetical protein